MLTHEGLELATSPNARPDVALLWRTKFSETRFRIFMKTAVSNIVHTRTLNSKLVWQSHVPNSFSIPTPMSSPSSIASTWGWWGVGLASTTTSYGFQVAKAGTRLGVSRLLQHVSLNTLTSRPL
jgi:hypothetical protein